ncbi:uncharacterized protein LOC142347136 [Convolutriloba macropyga]|uniref:uncharacterized protein LOC142347136 n=1 Tax=Convolutriloba macropyga TaxID=536237 RepID=UPI003F51C51F
MAAIQARGYPPNKKESNKRQQNGRGGGGGGGGATSRGQTVMTPQSDQDQLEFSIRQFKPCEECGEGNVATMHCSHCGQTLCEKDRAQHIKGVIDDLKSMKQSTAVKIKTANDTRGMLMRELKYVEHSRSKAKGQLVDTFKSHKFALEDQKRQVTKKLASFAKPELKGLQMDSNVVEECIKDLKRTESHFDARLGNYNPMSDADFSTLCQDYINYTNQINWLRDYTSKPDKIRPLEYDRDRQLEQTIAGYGEIVFKPPDDEQKNEESKKRGASNQQRRKGTGQNDKDDDQNGNEHDGEE